LREGIKTLIIKKICYGHDEEDLWNRIEKTLLKRLVLKNSGYQKFKNFRMIGEFLWF
jgi:hypothetical protein